MSAKDFIGQFIGDSEANVKKYVDKAMGGVLFIDEAYALNQSTGGYGMDAVNTLLTLLENRKGDFVCVMAGYTKTIDGFNCSGGVCRYVPKQEGVSMSYSFNW